MCKPLRILFLSLMLCMGSVCFAQPASGYYRAKNVGGYNGQQYVEVKGRITADASVTNSDKYLKPGTIIYLNVSSTPTQLSSPTDASQTVSGYEILNLRSQGIDVMNGCESSMSELSSAYPFSELLSYNFTSVYDGYVGFARYMVSLFSTLAKTLISSNISDATSKATFDSLMTDFTGNYLPNLKFQVYLIPVDGQTYTYLVRSMVPSLEPISNFYNNNKTNCDAVLIPAVRSFLENYSTYTDAVGFTGENITEEDDSLINSWYSSDGGEWHVKTICEQNEDGTYTWSYSTILSNDAYIFDFLKLQLYHAAKKLNRLDAFNGYFSMIHYDTPYYLIEGSNHDASGNRVYSGSTSLGFANDGTKSTANDLTNATNHAYWTLEAVGSAADNYFTVKPINKIAKNNKYYASTYLDFPFTPSSDVTVYTLSTDGIQDGTDSEGNTYQYVTFDECSGTVPAATPCIIEYDSPDVSESIALTPDASGTRNSVDDESVIQATFLGGLHKGDHETVSGSTVDQIKAILHNLYEGSLQDKWNVQTDNCDLYLFGYNNNDTNNPYGFYLYSKWSDSSDKTIPANKPFLRVSTSNTAKYYVFLNNSTTGIQKLEITDDTVDDNMPRYNLAGQRVNKNYKGVVIVNGHKFMQQ